jgi:hypothetical protein
MTISNNNLQCQCQISNVNVNFQSNFNPISMSIATLQSNVNVYVSIQFQFPMSMSMSLFNLNFQSQLSMSIFNSDQCQFTLNLLLGQQKWSCLFPNQVNNDLPSIGILLSQTFNWYLVTGQVPGSIQKRTTCTCLYTCASRQTASSIEQFVPSLCCVIGQTASSI